MEQVWVWDQLAVSVARIDFLDPAVATEPDARERGVRIEVRRARSQVAGSLYSSSTTTLEPAVCRIDFLESAPGAADRMHWHPEMDAGEPCDRVFEPTMPPDPVAWLTAYLLDLGDNLRRSGVTDVESLATDLAGVAAESAVIGRAVADGLAWGREPWPEVAHDERGMAHQG